MSPSLERMSSISSMDVSRSATRSDDVDAVSPPLIGRPKPTSSGLFGITRDQVEESEQPAQDQQQQQAQNRQQVQQQQQQQQQQQDPRAAEERGMQRQDSSSSIMSASSDSAVDVAVVNVKYRNDDGRNAVLSRSLSLHHDFGSLTSIVNVTLTRKDLDLLADDPNIHWVDRTGAVHYIQPSALGRQ